MELNEKLITDWTYSLLSGLTVGWVLSALTNLEPVVYLLTGIFVTLTALKITQRLE